MDTGLLMVVLNKFMGIFPFIAVGFGLAFLYKLIADRITPYDDTNQLRAGNFAVGLDRGGALLGIMLAAGGGLIAEPGAGYWGHLWMFTVAGLVAVGLFICVCYYVINRVILWKVKSAEQISNENQAVAIVHFCAYISLGIIMSASFGRGNSGFLNGVLSAPLFTVLGIAVFVTIYLVYSLWRRRQGLSADKVIGQGDWPAAIDLGSTMVAMSLALWFAIASDFDGWTVKLVVFGLAAAVNVVTVIIVRFFASILLARELRPAKGEPYKGNAAQSVLIGLVTIGLVLTTGMVAFV